jgi:hypothetical protein
VFKAKEPGAAVRVLKPKPEASVNFRAQVFRFETLAAYFPEFDQIVFSREPVYSFLPRRIGLRSFRRRTEGSQNEWHEALARSLDSAARRALLFLVWQFPSYPPIGASTLKR